MERKIIQTSDGSTSIYVPELDEHYHSIHGAVQESMHIFIEAGLKQIGKNEINIFEMGYGTGLNFILTFIHSEKKAINYHCIEAFPLDNTIIKELNYAQVLNMKKTEKDAFYGFHSEAEKINIDLFDIIKTTSTLVEYIPKTSFDLIYFDAFAPEVQPELWTTNVFQKMFNMLNPKGILTTYCAKGVVRRNMQSCGFRVERLPGPPGKREILRAIKDE